MDQSVSVTAATVKFKHSSNIHATNLSIFVKGCDLIKASSLTLIKGRCCTIIGPNANLLVSIGNYLSPHLSICLLKKLPPLQKTPIEFDMEKKEMVSNYPSEKDGENKKETEYEDRLCETVDASTEAHACKLFVY